jgi:hypothetical protein
MITTTTSGGNVITSDGNFIRTDVNGKERQNWHSSNMEPRVHAMLFTSLPRIVRHFTLYEIKFGYSVYKYIQQDESV